MKTKIKHTNKDDIKKKMDHLQPEKMKMTPSKQKQPLKAELICQLNKLEDEKQLLQKENLEMGNTIKQLENKLAHLEEKTKTRLGLQCQTPLSPYPLFFWPYPLFLI